MLNAPTFKEPALGSSLKDQELAGAVNTKPEVFTLKAQLLDQGRTDTVLAACENMIVRLKVYASGGENELHAHTGEDHTFIILQGSARFFGPNEEEIDLQQYQGILLPKGNYYKFFATSKEPLVMIRVGSPGPKMQKKPLRIDMAGKEMLGDSKENKKEPVIFREGAFFGA
ncbi:MAG TPA: cupin domain-containing protein [Alphaproteobacteria bacterium]|jgi:mannose-6-phosphate isomerase-like protein (cupin superfamily)